MNTLAPLLTSAFAKVGATGSFQHPITFQLRSIGWTNSKSARHFATLLVPCLTLRSLVNIH